MRTFGAFKPLAHKKEWRNPDGAPSSRFALFKFVNARG